MNKILLCGNGINIQFNKNFCFKNFINILINKKQLENEIDIVLKNPKYSSFISFIPDFLEIVEKCKDSLENLTDELKNNGVEQVIWTFLKSVDTLIRILGINLQKNNYEKFENFFKILFFNYFFKLELKTKKQILNNNPDWKKFQEQINKKYKFIFTLNYDSILDEIYHKKYIIHLHGQLFLDKNGLNFDNCLLESYQKPKNKISEIRKEAIFLDKEKLFNELSLDILGINPINDENLFFAFIHSKICQEINFYYYNKNDVSNLNKIIDNLNNYYLVESNNKIKIKKHNQNLIIWYIIKTNFNEKTQQF